jgi:hypothetical protein
MRWFRKNKVKEFKPQKVGTGEFKVIQAKNTYGDSGYVSLIIFDKEVVAQKFVTDGELYNEIFDYIVYKLGGRIVSVESISESNA